MDPPSSITYASCFLAPLPQIFKLRGKEFKVNQFQRYIFFFFRCVRKNKTFFFKFVQSNIFWNRTIKME